MVIALKTNSKSVSNFKHPYFNTLPILFDYFGNLWLNRIHQYYLTLKILINLKSMIMYWHITKIMYFELLVILRYDIKWLFLKQKILCIIKINHDITKYCHGGQYEQYFLFCLKLLDIEWHKIHMIVNMGTCICILIYGYAILSLYLMGIYI